MTFATWNTRALLGGHRRVGNIRTKRKLVGKLLDRHDVLFLQEVRGSTSDSDLYTNELGEHVVYTSHVQDGVHGGVMVAIKKAFLARVWRLSGS